MPSEDGIVEGGETVDRPLFPGFDNPVEIGRGAFGVVYRADDVVLKRVVAIKVLSAMLQGSDVERFRREAVAMSAMSGHPNVVPVFSTGVTAEGRPFLVMPYLASGTLRDRLGGGPLPWQMVVEIGVQIAGALESAHRRGIIHRDVKPENILTSEWGRPALTDFGIARFAGAFETVSRNVTASVVYAAPEILDGQAPTPQSDIYSLGATMFHLLAGHPAFAAGDDEALVAQYIRISRDPVPDLGPFGVPAVVCEVIVRAMSKRPADRQQSAELFAQELQAAQRSAESAAERVDDVSPTTMANATANHGESGEANAPTTAVANVQANQGANGEANVPTTDRLAIGDRPTAELSPEAILLDVRQRRRMLLLAVAVVLLVAVVALWLASRSSNPSAPSSVQTSPVSAVDVVDVSLAGGQRTLTDVPLNVPLHMAAGKAYDVRIDGQAGQRVLGHVTLLSKPRTAVPIALLFNESPIESKVITDVNLDIDPVVLDSTGTWILRVGPSTDSIDGALQIGLAPPDLNQTVQLGGSVDISLSRPRQRAFVKFDGLKGQRIVVSWVWNGADPLYTHLELTAPDGASLTSWDPLGSGTSSVVVLPGDGTYTIGATIDGDGTGAATLAVRIA